MPLYPIPFEEQLQSLLHYRETTMQAGQNIVHKKAAISGDLITKTHPTGGGAFIY